MGVREPTYVTDRESIAVKLRVLNTATLTHSHETESAFYRQFASRGELGQVHCIAIEEVMGSDVPLPARPLTSVKPPRADSRLNFTRRIKSRLSFAGIISRSPYSPRFQDKG